LGTLGGSLAHSDPAADFPAVILALGGSVKAVGPSGERTINADDLFVDLLTTSLAENEVLTEIQIPSASGTVGMAYEKHSHPASGYAVVGVAAVIGINNGTCQSARIAVTGATSKATRSTAAEQAITGQPLNADTIANAASVAADGLEINGEIYASAEYRTHLVRVYTKRALTKAAGL
jgi:carbon-monoxide dehydrogenase medium subunit